MKTPFSRINLPIAKELSFPCQVHSTIPLSAGGYLIFFTGHPEVAVLSHDLEVISTIRLSVPVSGYYHVAINDEANRYAFAQQENIQVYDNSGELLFTYEYHGWEEYQSCQPVFDSWGRLLFCRPGLPGKDDLLILANADTGQELSRIPIPNHSNHAYHLYKTTDPSMILLESAQGQEQTSLFAITIEREGISMEDAECSEDQVIGGFSPDGSEFVTAPHYPGEIEICSFPDFDLLYAVDEEIINNVPSQYESDHDEDGFDYTVFYLDKHTIVLKTRWGRVLMVDRLTLELKAELLLEGCEIKGYDQAGQPTTDPSKILDYEGDIQSMSLQHQYLVVNHADGSIKFYDTGLIW